MKTANADEEITFTAPAGGYTPVVTDLYGCMKSGSVVVIPEPDQISINVMHITPPRCYGEDGSVTLTVSGGTPPYTVTFDGQQKTGVQQGVPVTFNALPGSYTIEVEDYAGCLNR